MYKTYTSVLVLAAIMSSGCDSTCCGSPQNAPVVTAINNYKVNGATVTCNGIQSEFPLIASAKDKDNDLNTTAYQWSVDGNPVSVSAISCPLPGEQKRVCAVAVDQLSHQSDPFCIVLQGVPDASHPPIIHSVAGKTQNNLTISCDSVTMPLEVNATDPDNDIDYYVWKVDGVEMQRSNISCPVPGESEKICVTAYDKSGNQSNEFCMTLQKADCPKLSVKDNDDNKSIVNGDTIIPGHQFIFTYDLSNCPSNTTCTWSVKSHKSTNDNNMTCLVNNIKPTDQINSNHTRLQDNNRTLIVNTCASQYKYDRLYVTLHCSDRNISLTYPFQQQ